MTRVRICENVKMEEREKYCILKIETGPEVGECEKMESEKKSALQNMHLSYLTGNMLNAY